MPHDRALCRQCIAPLPAAGPTGIGACSACGTLFGTRAEIDEYARAMLAGRSDVQRPASLPGRRMRIDLRSSASSGHRDAADATSALNVRLGYAHGLNVFMWPMSVLAPAALAYGWWLHRLAGLHWAFLLAAVLVALYSARRFVSIFDRFELSVSRRVLRVQRSRFWPKGIFEVPVSEVVQVFVVGTAGRYAVASRLRDGKVRLLVPAVGTAELAIYLERQIELAAGLVDTPVKEELDRRIATPKRPSRIRAAAIELAVVFGVIASTVLSVRACGASVADLELGDEVSTTRFSVGQEATLFFSSDLDFSKAEWRYRDDIPRSLRYELTLKRDGVLVSTLSCDPIDMFVWTTSSSNKRITALEGSMNRCSVQLTPGDYELSGRRTWQPGVPRVEYDETRVVARLEH